MVVAERTYANTNEHLRISQEHPVVGAHVTIEGLQLWLQALAADAPQIFAQIAKQEYEKREARFRALARQWHNETGVLSIIHVALQHPAYRAILRERNSDTVRFILEDLRDSGGPWFDALEDLTGHQIDTTPGNLKGLRTAWLRWGKQQGLI